MNKEKLSTYIICITVATRNYSLKTKYFYNYSSLEAVSLDISNM